MLNYDCNEIKMNMTDFIADIENCLKVLQNGGIILYPTDTIWGIGCDATNADAVNKIIHLKKRNEYKSFVVLVATENDVLKHVAAPDLTVFDYLQFTKKPTTVIYENALGFADNIIASDGSVAIRICKDEFCKHLIKRFKKPLVSTSANTSSETAPKTFREINWQIKKDVDYTVHYKQDDETHGTPSSIIRWKNGAPIIIRP